VLETVAIAGQIVPLCQTGTEKTAVTLFGGNKVKGRACRTCMISYVLSAMVFRPFAGLHTATEIEATLELEIELLSRRKITWSSTG
jgi:hypothetical protein